MDKTAEIWAQCTEEIRWHIQGTVSDLIPYFNITRGTLASIKDELLQRISETIRSLSEGSAEIHPLFIESLRLDLVPMFLEAVTITGKFTLVHLRHLRPLPQHVLALTSGKQKGH